MTGAAAGRASAVSVFAAVAAIVAGSLVLSGWILGISPLTQLLPGSAAMKATTAIGLVALGFAVWLIAVTNAPTYAAVLGGFALVLGAAALQQDTGLLPLDFAPRVFNSSDMPAGSATSNMSVPASLCLMLLGGAVLAATFSTRAWVFQSIAGVALLISAGVLLGYLYGIDELSRLGSGPLIAPYSAISLLILTTGVLWLRPSEGITGVIVSDRVGGRMARKLLPSTIVIPILAGWILRVGQRQGLYDATLEIALVVLTTLTVLSIVIWRSARLLSDLDVRKLQADAALVEAHETFESRIEARTSEFVRTQQEAAEDQARLRRRQRMESLGHLAGSIAHDVNNMMTVVAGYSGVLLKRIADDDPIRLPILEIKKAGDRCSVLTRQLLAFGRRQVLVPTVVDLGETVADLNNMLPMIVGDDVRVRITRAPQPWPVRVDSTQIEQVIVNLIVNARDAMPEGGTLDISTENVTVRDGDPFAADVPPGDFVVIAIADTGVGMDADTLGHVFDPFFTTKSSGHGSGLGLSTAYGIVKQSGGHITVQSAPGQGTTFRIFLPRVHEPFTPARPPVDPPVGFETVLLVEDEDSVRDLLKIVLEQAGYWVIDARSGQEALTLAAARTGDIELVVSDVVMPGLTGPALVRALREVRPEIKALLISGYPRDDLAEDLTTTEAEFMQKPVTPEAFLICVRRLLDK